MKPTLVIAFPGGAYGSYLEWVLHTITSPDDVESVVADQGPDRGHNHKTNFERPVLDPTTWDNYVASAEVIPVLRVHPKNSASQKMASVMQQITDTAQHVILLYPDINTEILCLNNYVQKTRKNWWQSQLSTEIDQQLIYKNWPVAVDVPIDRVPVWIQREFLSYYLMPSWKDQIEWFFPDTWQHPRCLTVYVSELLWNFESTINKILNFWPAAAVKSAEQLLPTHAAMLSHQLNLTQDQVCQSIINCVITDTDLAWRELPLPSQAWVQWRLRQLNYEIACHGLEIFPTDSDNLKKIIYQM